MVRSCVVGLLVLVAMAGAPGGRAASAGTLERVQQAGVLRCAVSSRGMGLSAMDDRGRWRGFFADMCRALAAAVVGSAERVEFIETNTDSRFTILRRNEADVVMEGTTWTQQRDATAAVDFPGIYLFDGQGFIAHRSLGVTHLSELAQAARPTPLSICVVEQTTTMRNLEDWIADSGARLTVKRARSDEGALSAFFNHHCDLYTGDRISLHSQRRQKAPNSSDYIIFPETISKEPLAPMVPVDDRRWFDVVRWVVFATIMAEEKGVTAANAASMRRSGDPEVRRLLGVTPGLGQGTGLDDAWGWRVVTEVGNYGEIFDRNLGAGSPLAIERGLNALWTRGGLMFSPPLGG